MLTDEIVEFIGNQTILYAKQKNHHSFSVSPLEIRIIIATMMFTEYHTLKRQTWSNDEDLGIVIIKKVMSRNIFLFLNKKYMHLNDTEKVNKEDKIYKLTYYIVNKIKKSFKRY